jgi:serine O-acetyltransferase
MAELKQKIWKALRQEVKTEAEAEPILASFLYSVVLNHQSFEESLSFLLASKLASPTIHSITLRDVMVKAHKEDEELALAGVTDLVAVRERDAACRGYSQPFLYFKGYQSLQVYRVAHHLWKHNRQSLALHLQSRMSERFGVDIHPGAKIGKGVMFDHGMGIVIGETAVVEDDVSIMHEVTLGGTGKHGGDRHPKVRRGSLISVGAKILGNIEIGAGAKVGGGAVVLSNVAPHTTVAGIPAKLVGKVHSSQPSRDMDQNFAEDI